MIGYHEAREAIEKNCASLPARVVSLAEACGFVTATDVFAGISLPHFRNSAMDGYAVSSADVAHASVNRQVELRVAGESRAGDEPRVLGAFQTLRIMTGAVMPRHADAVIEKERAVVEDGTLYVAEPVAVGRNVRQAGEEIRKGALALPRGSAVNPGTVGFLSALGIETLPIHSTPRVSIVATGSELVQPGTPLSPGKIYDSNLPMLTAALAEMKIRPFFARRLRDDRAGLKRALSFVFRESDVVLVSGGVSVGEYDFVRELLAEEGVETVFWKVRQKPGKPVFFGKKKNTLVFGLPGNPASAFTCFYEYAYPALRLLMGHRHPFLEESTASLGGSVRPDADKMLFLKGKLERGLRLIATPLGGQQSHMLSSLCEADAFLVIPGSSRAREGDTVTIHSLPHAR